MKICEVRITCPFEFYFMNDDMATLYKHNALYFAKTNQGQPIRFCRIHIEIFNVFKCIFSKYSLPHIND